jgi:hypothetical protein
MKTTKTKQICLYLDEEDYNYIREYAKSEGRSMSSAILIILGKFFEEINNETK